MRSPMTKLFATPVLMALVLAFNHPAAAQSRIATLTGSVVDQTGAAIARASISVRREATGFARQIASDAQGAFQLTDLLPGEYAITVTSAGFTVAAERVMLQSGQTRRVELTLQIGSLNEDVIVLAT